MLNEPILDGRKRFRANHTPTQRRLIAAKVPTAMPAFLPAEVPLFRPGSGRGVGLLDGMGGCELDDSVVDGDGTTVAVAEDMVPGAEDCDAGMLAGAEEDCGTDGEDDATADVITGVEDRPGWCVAVEADGTAADVVTSVEDGPGGYEAVEDVTAAVCDEVAGRPVLLSGLEEEDGTIEETAVEGDGETLLEDATGDEEGAIEALLDASGDEEGAIEALLDDSGDEVVETGADEGGGAVLEDMLELTGTAVEEEGAAHLSSHSVLLVYWPLGSGLHVPPARGGGEQWWKPAGCVLPL